MTQRLTTSQPPHYLAAGPSGLWVVTGAPTIADWLLHYDRRGRRLLGQTFLPNGVGPIALGRGAVSVGGSRGAKLGRLDLRSGRMSLLHVPLKAGQLYYGGGCVWATQAEEDSLTRIDPSTGGVIEHDAGRGPAQVAAAGGRVFVASKTDDTLRVLSARTLRAVHPPLPMPFNPYAVTADARHVWVTGLGEDTLTEVAYR